MSGIIKQTPSFSNMDIDTNFHEKLDRRDDEYGSLRNLSKLRLGRSNDRLHETTPLFGLWQGYNSHKLSSSDEKLHHYIDNNTLFLPGQNQTNIRAHIGTTVIMDCKIVRPNLEKYVPVSTNGYIQTIYGIYSTKKHFVKSFCA